MSQRVPASGSRQEEPEALATAPGTTSTWAAADSLGTWSSLFRAASDTVFDLPPLESNLPLLRLSAVLLRISELIYDVDEGYVGSQVGIELPIGGREGDRASVLAKLIHFRGAMNADGLSSPEQWGVWDVDGLGLCIAFRGTASTEDVLIDMNIKPMPLEISINMRGVGTIEVHQGFYQGALRHLQEIQALVSSHAQQGGKPVPVWITGHSLGGGYANAVMLHMLANRSCAKLFASGGGSVTFGAPMVVYSLSPSKLYDQLQKLEAAAEKQAGDAHPPLQFHNFVNGADIVPRLLGASLDSVHTAIGSYSKILEYFTAGVKQLSRGYHPFGTYHFILGSEIRTPAATTSATSCSGGGRIGDATYAEQIAAQLAPSSVVKAYVRGASSGPAADHKVASYQAGLQDHMHSLAAAGKIRESDADSATLFVLADVNNSRSSNPMQSVGQSVGQASWSIATAVAGLAGRAALQRIDGQTAASAMAASAGSGISAVAARSTTATVSTTWGSYFATASAAAMRAAATAAANSGKDKP